MNKLADTNPPEILTKLALMNKEKKKQKKKGYEPRITLRVISRLITINQLFFLFIIFVKWCSFLTEILVNFSINIYTGFISHC